ncbi:MAG: uncharacterized protein K0S28_1636 [Paucimonas sp.]|nr:uncharacterized protein [Paucimonas sp.]
MVAHLSDEYLLELAQYFSSLHLPYPPPQVSNTSPAILEHGRRLVMSGDTSRNIPACIACHGDRLTGALPSIPSLLGLSRDYLNSQFGAWKAGTRRAVRPDCMATIAHQLTPDDVGAISSWLAAQPVPEDMTPVPASSVRFPMSCGSALQ